MTKLDKPRVAAVPLAQKRGPHDCPPPFPCRQIPLVAYSGASDIQLSVSVEKGLQLGEVAPGAAVRAPLTITNTGDRRAFVTLVAYRGERHRGCGRGGGGPREGSVVVCWNFKIRKGYECIVRLLIR